MQNTKGMAIGSLVCGIVSIVLAWLGYGAIVGLAAGIVAIVLAAKVRKFNDANKGLATGGLVTGIIGVVLCGILFACAVCATCAVATSAGLLA